MKRTAARLALILLVICFTVIAQAQISNFSHVIVVFQENRTPDNLFQGLCRPPFGKNSSCSTKPRLSQYNIQTSNWLDKMSPSGVTQPGVVALANAYDLYHVHSGFVAMCNMNKGACRMNGASGVVCTGTCPPKPQFRYVGNSSSILTPYLTLASSYGWANYMFQTNQGPSYPAHLYIFGGTSAPSATDDAAGTFIMDNVAQIVPGDTVAGCMAYAGSYSTLITPQSDNTTMFPCFDHQTMADLFDAVGVSWKYYTPSDGTTIWAAPNSIQHICMPSAPTGGQCTGPDWVNNVVTKPWQVLTDISGCNLPQVSWVIPTGQNSDHADSNTGGGPSWVASIVNAIGSNPQCKNGETYWDNTAIVITWDDWGGWYDHEPPTILSGVQGDYQYGFRVPLVVVSAYTPAAFVDNKRMDFGTILRFLEHNFNITEGALNFADARSTTDLTEFFNLNQAPRVFQTIPSVLDANYFIHDTTTPTNPDDD